MTAVPIESMYRPRRPEPEHRRTYQKVRRESRYAGGENWEPMTWREANTKKRALDLYREKLRQPGERTGAAPRKRGELGGVSRGAADLYKLLCDIAVRGRGRLEPSAAWLAKALNTSAKMVHEWKAQLKRHGFLDWRRRYVDRGLRGVRGPQVEQISNAYVLRAPVAALAALAALLKGKAPAATAAAVSARLSAREEQRRAKTASDRAKLLDGLDAWGINVALDPRNWVDDDDEGT